VFVLWGICHVAPPAQTNWPFTLMVASWSLVEVPRYLFYIVKLLVDDEPKRAKRGEPAPPKVPTKVPFPLVWIRYSLFLVLYVTGITGEGRGGCGQGQGQGGVQEPRIMLSQLVYERRRVTAQCTIRVIHHACASRALATRLLQASWAASSPPWTT